VERKKRQLRLRAFRGTADAPVLQPGELLYEHFTDHQLLFWRTRAKDLQEYHYLWFFELERQRAENQPRLIETLNKVPGIQIDLAGWGRSLAYKYSSAPLSCAGSLKWVGGRFNFGAEIDSARFAPFPALYLAEDAETGIREMLGISRDDKRNGLSATELNLFGSSSVAWICVEGVIKNIFDLTNSSNLSAFTRIISKFRVSRNVRAMEDRLHAVPLKIIATPTELISTFMAENWRELPTMASTPANSQIFGHFLVQAGFEGILFSSIKTGKRSLALFPQQFQNSESFVCVKEPPLNANCCELSAKTFKQICGSFK
jgi:hypothetical protein